MSAGTPQPRCPNCNGVYPYHNAPCSGGYYTIPPSMQFYRYQPADRSDSGCRPLKQLTEEDVRRIVREELDRRFDSTGVPRT